LRRSLLALLLLCATVAEAGEPLDGTWLYDAAASDPLEPLLQAMGFSTLERVIARRIAVTHVVDDLGDRVRVHIKTALKSVDRTVPLDGVAREEDGGNGEPALVAYRRADDGAIVADSRARGRDGVAIHLVTRRLVLPDGTMLVEIHGEKQGEPPFTVRRIFRRQG
jgi:hypothetical protein